uniref:ribosomal protein L20 n=1 Tax=Erythrolobus coxiae TaxID=362235 RepID=UPI001FCD1E54|nr:ribosomal protein L20 [Erythrolobus coxiae]UNJ17766.1 ribosomal protein L20 [Erythrolobus coxiae]
MTRVKRGSVARAKRKGVLKLAKGFQGSHSNLFRVANQQVMKSLKYAYVGRKRKKRDFRRLWITRINAASRIHDIKYSNLISSLKRDRVALNRKMLAQIATLDNSTFVKIIDSVAT